MDTGALYDTFTRPKVVTSMLLVGIGLGLALSVLMQMFRDQWFLPVASAALVLIIGIIYMVWLDRQELSGMQDAGPGDGPAAGRNPVLLRPESPAGIADTAARFALFSDTRVIRSMVIVAVGLGLVLCVFIILFHGTWFLPALIAALTIGTVAAYLCWLDGLDVAEGPGSS